MVVCFVFLHSLKRLAVVLWHATVLTQGLHALTTKQMLYAGIRTAVLELVSCCPAVLNGRAQPPNQQRSVCRRPFVALLTGSTACAKNVTTCRYHITLDQAGLQQPCSEFPWRYMMLNGVARGHLAVHDITLHHTGEIELRCNAQCCIPLNGIARPFIAWHCMMLLG